MSTARRTGCETPFLLGTDLPWNWRKVVEVFKRRMSIEELFRDEKNIRYGWGLRQTKVGTAGRLERLLLVLAFAYLLLLLIGLVCRTLCQRRIGLRPPRRRKIRHAASR